MALNCVANGRLLREGPFDQIWIQPAAGRRRRAPWGRPVRLASTPGEPAPAQTAATPRRAACSDRVSPPNEIAPFLNAVRSARTSASRTRRTCSTHVPLPCLADGKSGRLVPGPHGVRPACSGARSILGDARSPRMQATMNLKIKFRESFRPFAPGRAPGTRITNGSTSSPGQESPYMLLVAPVRERHRLPLTGRACTGMHDRPRPVRARQRAALRPFPAVTHVDYSARVQTVDAERNPSASIGCCRRSTIGPGCPVLVNTSFNVRGEPIVCTPQDAYRCFQATDMDALVLGDFVLRKEETADPAAQRTPGRSIWPSSNWIDAPTSRRLSRDRVQHSLASIQLDIATVQRSLARRHRLAGMVVRCGVGHLRLHTITAIGGCIGIAGLLQPWTIRPLFVGLMVLTAPIGWAVSQVFLAVVFFGVFTPIAMVFRLLGRDALKRDFEADAETYWELKVMPADPVRYFRTF